jgi:hypothetical protein
LGEMCVFPYFLLLLYFLFFFLVSLLSLDGLAVHYSCYDCVSAFCAYAHAVGVVGGASVYAYRLQYTIEHLWLPVPLLFVYWAGCLHHPPPTTSFVLDLASFISLRLGEAKARSAGVLWRSLCIRATPDERAMGSRVLRGKRQGAGRHERRVGVASSTQSLISKSYSRGRRTWAGVNRGAELRLLYGLSSAQTLISQNVSCGIQSRGGIVFSRTLDVGWCLCSARRGAQLGRATRVPYGTPLRLCLTCRAVRRAAGVP